MDRIGGARGVAEDLAFVFRLKKEGVKKWMGLSEEPARPSDLDVDRSRGRRREETRHQRSEGSGGGGRWHLLN